MLYDQHTQRKIPQDKMITSVGLPYLRYGKNITQCSSSSSSNNKKKKKKKNNNNNVGPESDYSVLGFSGFPQSHLCLCGKVSYLKSATVTSINILSHSRFTNIAIILQ
jgi:hypothetical protein